MTIDHQSLEDDTVTLRDRDSLAQDRVAIAELGDEIERRLRAPWTSPKIPFADSDEPTPPAERATVAAVTVTVTGAEAPARLTASAAARATITYCPRGFLPNDTRALNVPPAAFRRRLDTSLRRPRTSL